VSGEPAKSLRISHVGLRGIVGRGLTAAHVVDFASAFGTLLDTGGPVILGRDPRASGVMLRQGVIAGLLACGRDVIDLGIVSTPVVQHAIRRLGAAGGVSIGASHNAAGWNALKFFGWSGSYLPTVAAAELLDIYHLRKFDFKAWSGIGRLHEETGALDWYLDELAAHYDFAALRDFRVVVDCCNGTSSLILRRANERFGTSFILINEKIESLAFAHTPSTTADTVGLQLAPLMRPLGADAGFLFDVDSDRVAMATGDGVPVSEEMVLPLAADYLLPRGTGKLVITSLSTTALLEEVAARHGGRVLRVPVGRQATIDALLSYRPEQIALAGEGTGAVMMPQFRFVYDGIASMLTVLSMMRERGQKLTEILEGYPRFSILKGQFPLVTQRIPALLAELGRRYSSGRANTDDGLKVAWPDSWFHVRVSQTEPVVRVICEQRGYPPAALFEALAEEVRRFA
jgi:phosphomannomutase